MIEGGGIIIGVDHTRNPRDPRVHTRERGGNLRAPVVATGNAVHVIRVVVVDVPLTPIAMLVVDDHDVVLVAVGVRVFTGSVNIVDPRPK